jgi:hypothetical protein
MSFLGDTCSPSPAMLRSSTRAAATTVGGRSPLHDLDFAVSSMEETMNDLVERAIAAHGGLARWQMLKRLTVTAVNGGGLFALKGMPTARRAGLR